MFVKKILPIILLSCFILFGLISCYIYFGEYKNVEHLNRCAYESYCETKRELEGYKVELQELGQEIINKAELGVYDCNLQEYTEAQNELEILDAKVRSCEAKLENIKPELNYWSGQISTIRIFFIVGIFVTATSGVALLLVIIINKKRNAIAPCEEQIKENNT